MANSEERTTRSGVFARSASLLQKHLSLILPIAMAAGGLFGVVFDAAPLKVLVLPLTFSLVYPMMIGFDPRKLFAKGDAKLQASALILNFGVFPFIAFGLGLLAFRDNAYLRVGLLLAALLPTSGMTVTWTGLAKGNVPEAVRMTIIGLIAGSAATPLYLWGLMGTSVDLPVGAIVLQILVVVALPMLAGRVTSALLVQRIGPERFAKHVKPVLPGLSSAGVVALVFVAVALKARSIASNPGIVWDTLWPVVLFYAVNFAISSAAGRALFAAPEAKALVYGTVMRNLSIALAIAMGLLGPKGGEAALVLTWAYVVQVQSAAWYVRLSEGFFKAAESAE